MKNIKYLLWSFLAAGALLTACTETADEYEPAAKESGANVYIPDTFNGVVTVSGTETSVTVPVMRINSSEAVSIKLTASQDDNIFTVPSAVSFAAGEKETSFDVTFDPADLEYDEPYEVEITLDDPENTTVYGSSMAVIQVTLPAPWISLGEATFVEAFLFENQYKVELQQNQVNPTSFRLVDPYSQGYANPDEEYGSELTGDQAEYLEFEILPVGSTLGGTPITEEGWVYYPPTNLGLTDDGDPLWMYHPAHFTNQPIEYNKVVEWQDDEHTLPAVVQFAPLYFMPDTGYGYNYSSTPVVTIAFPGVVLADYSVEIELAGYFKNLEEENFAVVDVTLGEDVSKVVLASASGNDVNAILSAIVAGTVETVSVTADGSANLPVVDGKNTVVAVSYANGEPQEYDYITFTFYAGVAPELSPLEQEWTAADIYPLESRDELFKTWNMYAVDYFGDSGEREYLGEWTFSDNTEDDDDDFDAINLDGITLGILENDTLVWEFYNGWIYALIDGQPIGTWNYFGENYYVVPYLYDANSDNPFFKGSYAIFGGLVEDGYIAFVDNNNSGYNFNGFSIYIENVEDEEDAGILEWYTEIVLEDPALAVSTAKASARKNITIKKLNTLARNMATPINYVELRGRERAHALIDELNANKKQTSVEPQIEVIARKGSRFSKDMTVQASPVMLK